MRFNTLTFLLCLHALSGQAQEGYAPLADRIEIGGKDDWAAWQAPVGTRVLGEDGSVQPRFVRCLLYTSPSPRDGLLSRMPSSA